MADTKATIICHVTSQQPAGFIATFPGLTSATSVEVTASGRASENSFVSAGDAYDDEPVVVFEAPLGVSAVLMLPQELQATGADRFTALMQTGLQPAPGMDSHRLESIEPLLRRGVSVHPGSAIISVAPATSNILDVQAGTIGTAVNIADLNAVSVAVPVKATVGVTATGRFFGFRLSGTNTNSVIRYLGAILRGRRLS